MWRWGAHPMGEESPQVLGRPGDGDKLLKEVRGFAEVYQGQVDAILQGITLLGRPRLTWDPLRGGRSVGKLRGSGR